MSNFRSSSSIGLAIVAMLWLLVVHLVLSLRGFGLLHRVVDRFHPRRRQELTERIPELLRSIELARRLYIKDVACLHLAAATTLHLRTFGVPVQLVIGVSPHPFFGHAWVEKNGEVVTGTMSKHQFIILDEV